MDIHNKVKGNRMTVGTPGLAEAMDIYLKNKISKSSKKRLVA